MEQTALDGLDNMFEGMPLYMKKFKKKTYAEYFDHYQKKIQNTLENIESAYELAEDKGSFLGDITERFLKQPLSDIDSIKRRGKKENLKVDYTMFLVTYVFPAILEYNNKVLTPLADEIQDKWNKTLDMKVEYGDYKQIASGFRNSLFGINLPG